MEFMKLENELDLNSKDYLLLKKILSELAPNNLVWIYGSRINGKAKKSSDLDLVIFGIDTSKFIELKEAFEESDITCRVDIMVWEKIPDTFKKNILEKHLVL